MLFDADYYKTISYCEKFFKYQLQNVFAKINVFKIGKSVIQYFILSSRTLNIAYYANM